MFMLGNFWTLRGILRGAQLRSREVRWYRSAASWARSGRARSLALAVHSSESNREGPSGETRLSDDREWDDAS
jgi:hypothetical protein